MCRITFFDVQSIIIVNFIWLDIFIVYDDNRTSQRAKQFKEMVLNLGLDFEDSFHNISNVHNICWWWILALLLKIQMWKRRIINRKGIWNIQFCRFDTKYGNCHEALKMIVFHLTQEATGSSCSLKYMKELPMFVMKKYDSSNNWLCPNCTIHRNPSFDCYISDFLKMFSNNILKPHTFLNNMVCTFDKYKFFRNWFR